MKVSEVGAVVRAYRKATGISQKELASLVGISRATLNYLESGREGEIGASKLLAMLELLGVPFDVPAVVEFARNDEERAILELISSTGYVGRALMTTPGVPAERVTALRAAFTAMLKDAEFADALARTQAEFAPVSGEEMQAFAAKVRDLPPALVEKARASVKR